MKDSRIFKPSELRALEDRKQGSKKDPAGIFAGKVKPKIQELLEFWFPQRKELEALIKKK